jgi:hypothetical protein
MSRYEKINYDELEMLAANGGMDQPPVPYTVMMACTATKGDFCKGVSKGVRDGLRATVAASKAILTVKRVCWWNIKPKN